MPPLSLLSPLCPPTSCPLPPVPSAPLPPAPLCLSVCLIANISCYFVGDEPLADPNLAKVHNGNHISSLVSLNSAPLL